MGCNCKAQNDFKKISDKYGDKAAEINNNRNKMSFKGVFQTFLNVILSIITGILSCVLFIIMAIPMIIYVMGFILVGKEPVVTIPWMGQQKKLEKKLKIANGKHQ